MQYQMQLIWTAKKKHWTAGLWSKVLFKNKSTALHFIRKSRFCRKSGESQNPHKLEKLLTIFYGEAFRFQQDLALVYIAVAKETKTWLIEHGVAVLDRAAKSDLYGFVSRGRRETPDDLKAAIKATWASIYNSVVPQVSYLNYTLLKPFT